MMSEHAEHVAGTEHAAGGELAARSPRYAALPSALARGLDWRLLSLWLIGTLLPTLLVALPVWRTLAAALDRYPLSGVVARRFDMLTLEDLQPTFEHAGPALGSSAILAVVAAVIISPLLTGAMLAAAAQDDAARSTLLQRAIAWYRRSFRMQLLALIPTAIVVAVGLASSKVAGDYANRATLESHADLASRLALLVTVLLAVPLHVSIEAARAELAVVPSNHAAWRAWLRGTRKALRQPLSTLVMYLVPTLLSLALAALFLLLRLHVSGATPFGFGVGVLVTQLSVLSLGWGRASRLFALTALFRASPPS